MFITVKFSNAMDKEKIVKFSEGQKRSHKRDYDQNVQLETWEG